MRLLILGAPGLVRDSWQDDLAADAERIGWDVSFIKIAGRLVDDVVQLARGADVVIWCYTHNHLPSGNATTMLRRIEDAGAITIGIHLDLYWGLPREQRIGQYAWWTCQRVYTADGGERDWTSRRVNHVWCPPAVALRNVKRDQSSGRYRAIFVGGYTNSIHGNHRMQLIAWGRRRWRSDFHWYGVSTHDKIFGPALGAAVARAECVLGDSAPASHYWSDRVPRIMARGAVLTHPRVEGMKELGFDESTLVLHDRYDFDGLGRQLDEIDPARREELRESALAVVRDRHLWEHRLRDMVAEADLA